MLINLRNALMSKAGALPRPVEYIESDGNQWIEIGGLSYGSNTGWMCDFSVLPAMGWGICGATRLDSDFNTDIGMMITGGGRLRIDRHGRSSYEFAVNTGRRQQVSMNPKGNINSSPYRYYSTLAGYIRQADTWYSRAYQTTNKTIAIFWRKWQISGATPELPASMRFYGFELREYSSATAYTTTLKLSPVSVGGVGAILDEITGETYFNAGTGDFVLGPDVVPVEYIESHGTEYIDTGVVPTTTKTEITFSTPTPPSLGYMCGSFNANNNRYYPATFSGSSTRYINLINAANTVISQYTNDGNVHTVVYNATGGACYFDGAAAGTLDTTTLTASNPIYLFCTSTSTGASGLVSGRIYSCKLYDANGTLVRDLIPVRVGTEGAMMDTLTRRIYRNAGKGAFTYGNDLKYPIPAS